MKQYTWKQKNWALWLGAALFAVLAYRLALVPTLELRHSVLLSERSAVDNAGLDEEWLALKARKKQMDGWMARSATDGQALVHRLAMANGSQVLHIPGPLHYENRGTVLAFQEYGLQGRFAQLLRTLWQLEKEKHLHLIHARFALELDEYTRKPRLWLQVHTLNMDSHEQNNTQL